MHSIFFFEVRSIEMEFNSISAKKVQEPLFKPKKKRIFFRAATNQIENLHQNIFSGQLNGKKSKNCIKCELFPVLPRF